MALRGRDRWGIGGIVIMAVTGAVCEAGTIMAAALRGRARARSRCHRHRVGPGAGSGALSGSRGRISGAAAAQEETGTACGTLPVPSGNAARVGRGKRGQKFPGWGNARRCQDLAGPGRLQGEAGG